MLFVAMKLFRTFLSCYLSVAELNLLPMKWPRM